MTPAQATKLLLEAGRDEQKLTLAAIEIAIAAYPEEQQGRIRDAIFASAVPHWFDPTILGALLDGVTSQETERLYSILRTFSFVENFAARSACNIHERTRLTLLRWLHHEQKRKYGDLSLRAAKHFIKSTKPHCLIECIYHLLIAKPEAGTRALERLWDVWDTQGYIEPMQALAAMLEEHLSQKRLVGCTLAAALYTSANVQRNYRPLAKIERRLKQALRIFGELHNQHGKMVIFNDIGDVQHDKGRSTAALRSFRSALAIAKRLATREPKKIEWIRAVGVAQDRIGNIQLEEGHLAAALRSFQASLAISKKLVVRNPKIIQWRHDLQISHTKIGDVYAARNRLSAALRSFQTSLAIAKKLAARDSKSIDRKRDIAALRDRIGSILEGQGRFAESGRSFQESLAIAKKVAKCDPKNNQRQRELSTSYQRIGNLRLIQRKWAMALQSFQSSLDIDIKLVIYDPENAEWQRDLFCSHGKIAQLERARGNLAAALRSFQAALDIAKKLAAHNPKNTQWQDDLKLSQRDVTETTKAVAARLKPKK